MNTKEKVVGRQQSFALRFRLGVYDAADDNAPVVYHRRVFTTSPEDRAMMQNAIDEFNRLAAKRPKETRCIAAFPCDS